MVIETDLSAESATEVADKILQMTPCSDGLFAANDFCAVSVMSLLKKNGLNIPTDIAVVGFNNDPIATVIEPNLTTIHYQGKEMGEIAMQSIIHHLNGSLNINPTNTIILHSKLIVRDSSLKKGK